QFALVITNQNCKKTDGGIRITHDYRILNDLTVKDAYPVPVIDNVFMLVKDSYYFTKKYCFSGFYKIKLDSNSRQFTSFACEMGLFQFIVMPMGADRRLHYLNVLAVVEALRKHKIKIKLSKCIALTKKVKFLIYVISFNSLKPDPEKLAAISNFQPPTNMQQLQSFFGLTGFYRKFIESYAKIVKPLYELMHLQNLASNFKNKNGKILTRRVVLDWNQDADDSFYLLKKIICSYDHILVLPDFSKHFIVGTDECYYAHGGVVSQLLKDVVRPIAYYSGQFTKTLNW
ncbi:unnamed protein product, partial [Brachionus calyciflorus]